MSKAAIYTALTTPASVAAGGTIPLGAIVRRYGNDPCGQPMLDLNGNGITVSEGGYYSTGISITVLPVAAGAITATLLKDGAPVPGATATGTAAAAGNAVNLSIESLVRQVGQGTSSTLTVLLSAAGTVNNMAFAVKKD